MPCLGGLKRELACYSWGNHLCGGRGVSGCLRYKNQSGVLEKLFPFAHSVYIRCKIIPPPQIPWNPFGGMEGNRQVYWAVFTPVYHWHHASVQRQPRTFNFSHARQQQTVPVFVLMIPSGASHNCVEFSFQTRCNGSNTWNPLTFTVRKFIISHWFGINVFAWLLGL